MKFIKESLKSLIIPKYRILGYYKNGIKRPAVLKTTGYNTACIGKRDLNGHCPDMVFSLSHYS